MAELGLGGGGRAQLPGLRAIRVECGSVVHVSLWVFGWRGWSGLASRRCGRHRSSARCPRARSAAGRPRRRCGSRVCARSWRRRTATSGRHPTGERPRWASSNPALILIDHDVLWAASESVSADPNRPSRFVEVAAGRNWPSGDVPRLSCSAWAAYYYRRLVRDSCPHRLDGLIRSMARGREVLVRCSLLGHPSCAVKPPIWWCAKPLDRRHNPISHRQNPLPRGLIACAISPPSPASHGSPVKTQEPCKPPPLRTARGCRQNPICAGKRSNPSPTREGTNESGSIKRRLAGRQVRDCSGLARCWSRRHGSRSAAPAHSERSVSASGPRRGVQVAAVAVARKLVVLCWHVLSKDEDYAFARTSLTRQKTRRLELTAGASRRARRHDGLTVSPTAAQGVGNGVLGLPKRFSGTPGALRCPQKTLLLGESWESVRRPLRAVVTTRHERLGPMSDFRRSRGLLGRRSR